MMNITGQCGVEGCLDKTFVDLNKCLVKDCYHRHFLLDSYFDGHTTNYKYSDFCKMHYTRGCTDLIQERDPDKYCCKHICHIGSCQEKAQDTYKFCQKHCCIAIDCPNSGGEQLLYCYDHKCRDVSCLECRVEPFSYCLDHKCGVDLCKEKRYIGKFCQYCNKYKCTINDCQRIKEHNSLFCKDHHSHDTTTD